MKITALFLICLISATFAITKVPASQMRKNIEALRKDKTWSKIVLSLAELHMMSDFPLADLIDALEELVHDLQDKALVVEQQWQERQDRHHADVHRYTNEIGSASEDVSNATDDLENNLYPRRSDLQQSIVQAQQNIDNNNARLSQLANQRETDHNDWALRVEEHNSALSALDEAVNLLQQLAQENNTFVQVKFAKQNLNKVSQRLGKHLHETLAKALVSVATSEFADVRLVRDVIQKLQSINQNIANSLIEENQNEERQLQEYNDEKARLEQNNVENELRLNNDRASLESTNYSIQEQEDFRAQRQSDLEGFQNDLQNENDNFQQDTVNHDDLAAQLQGEVNASAEALRILQDGSFSDYMNQVLGGVRA